MNTCHCGILLIGYCVQCNRGLCQRHATLAGDLLMCNSCAIAFYAEVKAQAPERERALKMSQEAEHARYMALPQMDTATLATWLTSRDVPQRGAETSRPGPVSGLELLAAIRLTRIPPKTRPNQGSWLERRRNPRLTIGWPVSEEHKNFHEMSYWSESRHLQPDGRTLVERSGMRTELPTNNETLPASHTYDINDLNRARFILCEWQRHYPGGATLLPETSST